MLTPYFIINTKGLPPIKEVIVGPTPHKNLAMSSISSFLGAKGFTGHSVFPSNIPFRGW